MNPCKIRATDELKSLDFSRLLFSQWRMYMNPKKKAFLRLMAAFIVLSLACSLPNVGSIIGAGTPASSGAGAGSTPGSSSGVDLGQFSGGTDLPLVVKGPKTFSADKFLARSLPVEVVFSGAETADVLFKGAIAEPDYNISATPPKFLVVFIVLQKNSPNSILSQQNSSQIGVDYWVENWLMEMMDSSGNVLSSAEEKSFGSLIDNVPQAVRGNVPQIPDVTSSVRVTISMSVQKMGLSCATPTPGYVCATTADLGFRMPDPISVHSPLQLTLSTDAAGATYTKKGVVGGIIMQYKNPFKVKMEYHSTLLLLDDSGALVGYDDNVLYMEPNATSDVDRFAQFYLSGIPTKALVYDRARLEDLIRATR
jgi:hypothetical protein